MVDYMPVCHLEEKIWPGAVTNVGHKLERNRDHQMANSTLADHSEALDSIVDMKAPVEALAECTSHSDGLGMAR